MILASPVVILDEPPTTLEQLRGPDIGTKGRVAPLALQNDSKARCRAGVTA